MKVTVIGAGIGGMAAALACARRGWSVDVYEQAAKLAEVGAGLQVSPNGFAVLHALGLGDAAVAASFPSQGTTLFDGVSGRRVLILPNAKPSESRLFHRADLLALLVSAATDAGVWLHLGRARSPDDFPDSDLVIAADGLRSSTRQSISPSEPTFTGQVAWRAIIPLTVPVAQGGASVFMGAGRHMVLYPLRSGKALNIVGIEERSDWTQEGWNTPGDVHKFQRVFRSFGGPISKISAQVEHVHQWGLFLHPVAECWSNGNVALLGDAAHATLPFLAQGANMALEDGWVLADCVDGAGDIAGGLARYQTLRLGRTRRIVAEAYKNARRFHLSNPLVRRASHMGLAMAGAFVPGLLRRRYDWLYKKDVTKPQVYASSFTQTGT